MRTRRGSAFWPDGLSDMMLRFQPGDVVVPTTTKQEHFLGVVKEVLHKINKIMVLWNGGSLKQHDPDEIMLEPHQNEIVRTRMAKTRRVRGEAAKEFSANFRQGGARTARLSSRDAVRWLQKNVNKLTNIKPDDVDEIHDSMVEDGVADDNDRDYSVIEDVMEMIGSGMEEMRKNFRTVVRGLNPLSVRASEHTATGEMGEHDIQPGGEHYGWAQQIENAAKMVQRLSRNLTRFQQMKPFDVYQGPYAQMNNAKIWSTQREGFYFIESFQGGSFGHRTGPASLENSFEGSVYEIADWLIALRNKKASDYLHLRSRRAIDFPTQDAYDKYMKEHPDADKSLHDVKKTEKKDDYRQVVRREEGETEEEARKRDEKETYEWMTREPSGIPSLKEMKRLKKEDKWGIRKKNASDYSNLRSRRAMYWGAPDRIYRLTRNEQENGNAICPRCKKEMQKEPFTKSDKLYTCQSCGFKVPTSKTTTTRVTVDVDEQGEVDVDVTTAGRGRKSNLAREMIAIEFPTQDAYDKYMKEHPDADKSLHRVVETKKEPAKKEEKKPAKSLSKQEHTHKVDEGTSIRVYDNGGKTVDRYSVIIDGKDWESSASPGYKPSISLGEGGRGVSQFGDAKEGKHLGKPVKFGDLDEDTKKHILERLKASGE